MGTNPSGSFIEKLRIIPNGSVGIGTSSPAAKLDVAGGIRVANDPTTCMGSNAGTIRWTGSMFEGCNGTSWMPLTGGGGGGAKLMNQSWCGGTPTASSPATCPYSLGSNIGDTVVCNPRGMLPWEADFYCYVSAPGTVTLVITGSSPTGLGSIFWDFAVIP